MKPIATTTENESLQLFQGAQIRYVWDEEKETYFFCVNDVIAVLTESVNPSDYLKKVKKRDEELSKGWGQIVTPLKISTEGGIQTMNCADVGVGNKLLPTEIRRERYLRPTCSEFHSTSGRASF